MPSCGLERGGPSAGPPRGGCRTRRPSCRPSRRSRRSGTRRRRRAGRGTRSPRCAAGSLVKWSIRSRQLLVGELGLADRAVEVDVVEHALQAGLCSSSAARALLSPSPTLWCSSSRRCAQRACSGHEEGVGVEVRVDRPASRPPAWVRPLASCSAMISSRRCLEHVRAPLQEQHPEDVLLELRGIHLPAQDVGGGEEVAFELGEGQLHACTSSRVTGITSARSPSRRQKGPRAPPLTTARPTRQDHRFRTYHTSREWGRVGQRLAFSTAWSVSIATAHGQAPSVGTPTCVDARPRFTIPAGCSSCW